MENFQTNSYIHRQYNYVTQTLPSTAEYQMPTLKDYQTCCRTFSNECS